jgi:hypothetical protein
MANAMIASETLAETVHALRDAKTQPMFSLKRQANLVMVAVLALSLLAASALPSHADRRGDNIAKVLGAALVIGLIANSLDDKPKHHPAPLPEPARHRRVPAVCAIEIEGSTGDRVTVYPEKCLRREGFTYQLPDCARNVRIYGKRDRIYPASCLRNAGFRVGR